MQGTLGLRSGALAVGAALLMLSVVPAQAVEPTLTAAAARVDPATVSVQTITPAEAYALKTRAARAVLLLDIRRPEEVASTGSADGVDGVVTFTQAGDPSRFADAVRTWAAALGGNEDTPILLLCRSGHRAVKAARMLTLAGFTQVRPIAGGADGELGDNGQRVVGWRESQPWWPPLDDMPPKPHTAAASR